MKKMILSVIAHNNLGVIARVSGLFTRRGFSLTSLAGEDTHEPTISRLTLSIEEEEKSLLQIQRQLEKLVDIKEVEILEPDIDVARDLALIKVKLSPDFNKIIKNITKSYDFRVVDVNSEAIMFQVCSTKEVIDNFIEVVRPYGILESARTGVIALASVNR
ncbi:acetolactate synthase small subunit [Candidatus Epulonipiscium viviparus]|uniref:acetolactate synthase small subunit n=1 Tax=Candidatus Epulonipiscium viviparus TaxID=420336 RepID=UPI00273805E1|nr:acetolactate synthase small subunit [Candidatus Epulopiscium viviparus]